MRHLYWDSCVLIYRLQEVDPWHKRIGQALSRLTQPRVVVSELSRLECRVKPLRDGDLSTLAKFDGFFAAPAIGYASLSHAVFDLATDLRARYGLKTPDALHLAAAINDGCDEFWTNDRRLNQAASGRIQIVTVDQLP